MRGVHIDYSCKFSIQYMFLNFWSWFKNIYWASPLCKKLPGAWGHQPFNTLPFSWGPGCAAVNINGGVTTAASFKSWPMNWILRNMERGWGGVCAKPWLCPFQSHLCLTSVQMHTPETCHHPSSCNPSQRRKHSISVLVHQSRGHSSFLRLQCSSLPLASFWMSLTSRSTLKAKLKGEL